MLTPVADFRAAAARRDEEFHRYAQAAALVKLFWAEHFRHASSIFELTSWSRTTLHLRNGHVDPELILTKDEIKAAVDQARRARSGRANPAFTPLVDTVRHFAPRGRS
jgi:hypothetical protein